jgi:hypothetical protein
VRICARRTLRPTSCFLIISSRISICSRAMLRICHVQKARGLGTIKTLGLFSYKPCAEPATLRGLRYPGLSCGGDDEPQRGPGARKQMSTVARLCLF